MQDPGRSVTSPIDPAVTAHYCTDWGYAETDPQWIDSGAAATGVSSQADRGFTKATLQVSGPGIHSSGAIEVGSGAGDIHLSVQSLDGRVVRDLRQAQSPEIFWDTRDTAGRNRVSSGTYIVKASMGGHSSAETIIVR